MKARFDIIGDIHGQLAGFRRLLGRLGWQEEKGLFRHPQGRLLVSVGDVINKGPDPLGCLDLVQDLVEAGRALMILGNHELNALHFQQGLRPRTPGTTAQFARTLAQIDEDPARWTKAEAFLRRLPFHLELDHGRLQVVHAAWPLPGQEPLPANLKDPRDVGATARGGRLEASALHCVKGPEESSEPYVDRNGVFRQSDRVPWWRDRDPEAPLIAFGHYCFPWSHRPEIPSEPTFLGPGRNAACLDFGAGNGDRLVALRWPEREFLVEKIG